MFKLGRLLQFVALVILPLAMVAQLSGSISLGQMLQFLFVASGHLHDWGICCSGIRAAERRDDVSGSRELDPRLRAHPTRDGGAAL